MEINSATFQKFMKDHIKLIIHKKEYQGKFYRQYPEEITLRENLLNNQTIFESQPH